MTYKEALLMRLTEAVGGTEREFYSEGELEEFATTCEAEAGGLEAKAEADGRAVARAFVNFWWDRRQTCRRCSVCGRLMCEGYCENMGEAYFCSDACLHSRYTTDEWLAECASNDQSYFTTWR